MPVSDTQMTHSYHQEDIQQILNLAIARQSNDGEFTRTQLVEIADELGISAETLIAAEQEWLLRKDEIQKRDEFNLYRHKQLKKGIGKYVIVNSFLIILNLLSAGQLSWSLYILLIWGLWLGLRAWNTYQLEGEDYERAFQKWYRKHQLSSIARSIFTRIDNWLKSV
jgi:hypothetical protein